jgi:hypothetical protein
MQNEERRTDDAARGCPSHRVVSDHLLEMLRQDEVPGRVRERRRGPRQAGGDSR